MLSLQIWAEMAGNLAGPVFSILSLINDIDFFGLRCHLDHRKSHRVIALPIAGVDVKLVSLSCTSTVVWDEARFMQFAFVLRAPLLIGL